MLRSSRPDGRLYNRTTFFMRTLSLTILLRAPCVLLYVKLQRNELAVDLADRLKYELELKNFHIVSLDALATTLNTSVEHGLAADTAAGRLAQNGPNIITAVKTVPMWLRFVLCFCTGTKTQHCRVCVRSQIGYITGADAVCIALQTTFRFKSTSA
jgi:Cation transporter/ATPase, N-terminus